MPIGQTIGLLVVPLLLGIVLFNGTVMLISPATWFRLPRYIAFRGTLRDYKYLSTPLGRLQIRGLGLVMAVSAGWMIAGFFGVAVVQQPQVSAPTGVPFDWWIGVSTCFGAIGCGVIVLLNPKWWIEKYFRNAGDPQSPVFLERALRIIGILFIAVGIYFLLQFVAFR